MPHPHLMPEAWIALCAVVLLGVFAFFGLSNFIGDCFDAAREEQEEIERVRKLKQRNIRHLITQAADSTHHESELVDALHNALEDYRA